MIVPFSRPEHWQRVAQNFERQRFPGKKLIVVVNGPAHGSLASVRAAGVTFLSSGPHQSLAKNTALAFIREQGGGFFATMDDDDWYGPSYLDEIAGYAKSYDVLGKQWHFVSLSEGSTDPAEPPTLICSGDRYASRETGWLTGGTLSGWAERALDFPVLSSGEDTRWCELMARRGARIFGLSPYHYLYRRNYAGARHTWLRSRQAFLASLRGQSAIEFPLSEAGDIDLDIVTGDKLTHYRELGKQRFVTIAK